MVQIRFDILNRLGVDHECDGQTDRQADRLPLAITNENQFSWPICNAWFKIKLLEIIEYTGN